MISKDSSDAQKLSEGIVAVDVIEDKESNDELGNNGDAGLCSPI
jgi:hypothetical protein